MWCWWPTLSLFAFDGRMALAALWVVPVSAAIVMGSYRVQDKVQAKTMAARMAASFSGGERQRISIARAFLKDAPIILLDEATASLDVENETAIQEALSRLIKHKTVLIIAHRMRTVAGADQVVVLSGGIVAEQGSPVELYARKDCTPTWWICSRQARIGRPENDGDFYLEKVLYSVKKLWYIVLYETVL